MRYVATPLLLLLAAIAGAQVTLTQGTNFTVDAAPDGRLAMDLLGTLWILPADGGAAVAVAANTLPVQRPQWSPDGASIVYQADADGQQQIWRYRVADAVAERIDDAEFSSQHPEWHPDGERIVFSSARHGNGFDLWELDLATRLSWRISDHDGDELEPAWSANGRDLVYIHHFAGQWSIVLRRLGAAEQVLLTSSSRLSAPRWRPDGSLVTFLRQSEEAPSIDMIVLADPPLIRPLITREDFFVAPLSWLDRENFVYAANGAIRKRNFNSWSSTNLPFRATIGTSSKTVTAPRPPRALPSPQAPTGRLVLRTARLFDGIGGGYQYGIDVLVDGGHIEALEPARARPGEIVVDLGNSTALPGFIDALAALPVSPDPSLGAVLLSFGVTTIVTEHAAATALDTAWSGKETPGPRVLAAADIATADPEGAPWLVTLGGDLANGMQYRDAVAAWAARGVPVLAGNWQVALGSGAAMLLGADRLPMSPGGHRYADGRLGNGAVPVTIFSGLADVHTPGLQNLLRVRQADLLPAARALRRLSEPPQLKASALTVVLGSRPNGLPPGMALHAEFLALAAAGLSGEQLLRAAGVNAAAALGAGLQLGRLAPGSVADIVVVDGDPLGRPSDLVKVVGVVRNGRFYSAIGLLERARPPLNVE